MKTKILSYTPAYTLFSKWLTGGVRLQHTEYVGIAIRWKLTQFNGLLPSLRAIGLGNTERDGFMPYHRYEGLDGKLKTFNSDKGVVWRRSRFCGHDRPEPYQWNFVYEVRHLAELSSGFVLVRSFDLADELYLEASEAAENHPTSREFWLLSVEGAQLFIQGMNCEPVLELEGLGSLMPQGPQMPPVSDSQSEDDILPHAEPQEQQEPVASDTKFAHGVPIKNKKLGALAVFVDLRNSGKIIDISPKGLTRFIARIADKRFPDLAPFTPQDVNNALKKYPDSEPYLARRGNSVKAIPSSGDNRNHLLDGNWNHDNGEQSAIDVRLDQEAKLQEQAELQKWTKISNRDSKKGN